MLEITKNGWFSEEEVVLDRMRAIHRRRVEAVHTGTKPLILGEGGKLIVHIIPVESIRSPKIHSASDLQRHGQHVRPLGERGGSSRFNADGYVCFGGSKELRAYTQLYRDGRLEAAMSDASYKQDSGHFLRDRICEQAVIAVVREFTALSKNLGMSPPAWLFASLVDVEGVRIYDSWGFSDHSIDRPLVTFPELEITGFDLDPASFLRPLFDCMWNAAGYERSANYDDAGKRQERQR